MNPLIGVTSWRRTVETPIGPDELQAVSSSYTDTLISHDMTPLVLPAGQSPHEAARLIEMIDGLLITGGDDLDPATYGQEVTESRQYIRASDDFEVALVRAARAANKPLLAICRGFQLLNVALGGTLHQEIIDEDSVHGRPDDDWREIVERRHLVRFEPGSTIGNLYGSSEAKVNTLHHQGVDRLAEGVTVEAIAEDGLIEAFKCNGSWWALGMQWHPERLEGIHHGVFQAFREAIAA